MTANLAMQILDLAYNSSCPSILVTGKKLAWVRPVGDGGMVFWNTSRIYGIYNDAVMNLSPRTHKNGKEGKKNGKGKKGGRKGKG